jgi:hypothetical protein
MIGERAFSFETSRVRFDGEKTRPLEKLRNRRSFLFRPPPSFPGAVWNMKGKFLSAGKARQTMPKYLAEQRRAQ